MPQTLHHDFLQTAAPVRLRRVAASRPLYWLGAGWEDLKANPIASLSYGILFAIAGDLILLLALPRPHLFSLAISAFFLLAPLLAAGLYEISRRQGRGQSSRFIDSLGGWQRNGETLAMFGLALALITIVWERTSAIIFALLYQGTGDVGSGMIDFFRTVVMSGEHLDFVAIWFVAGGLLAAFVFAISAISVPMMIDLDHTRGGDLVTATLTSLRAVQLNLDAMLLWALILVGLTLLGFATFLFGLIVIMPWLGHATWHAYRDLVEPTGTAGKP